MVRQSPTDPTRWFFDFDKAAPGGRGGASLQIDPSQCIVSVDAVFKNALLPRRSTGGLLADGLRQVGMLRPRILEAYNVVEKTTRTALQAGATGQGTLLGNLLEDAVNALGGTVSKWEPVQDGSAWHLRVHVDYP